MGKFLANNLSLYLNHNHTLWSRMRHVLFQMLGVRNATTHKRDKQLTRRTYLMISFRFMGLLGFDTDDGEVDER